MSSESTRSGASSGGLLGKWIEALLKNGGSPPTNPKDITDELRKSLLEAWEILKKWLMDQESNEIGRMCDGEVERRASLGDRNMRQHYLKVLCTGVAEIKYFINGVKTERDRPESGTDKTEPTVEALDAAKSYARCIVGAVALSEIYGDHCKLREVVGTVESEVDAKLMKHLEAHAGGRVMNKCEGMNPIALMLGKALLQEKIKQWTQEKRDAKRGKGEGWRVGILRERMGRYCTRKNNPPADKLQAKREQSLQENKGSMVSFLGMKEDDKKDRTGGLGIADLLADIDGKYKLTEKDLGKALKSGVQGDGTFQVDKAIENLTNASEAKLTEECMKDSSKESFCERLKCAEKHWELTKQQSNNDKFWDNYVNDELRNLFNWGTDINSRTARDNCDKGDSLNSANKEACKHITAKLEVMYRKASGKHQLSDQIIHCLMLKAYAEKLKEQAKQKGYCDIQPGITKAFSAADDIKEQHCINKELCIVCNLDDYDKLKDCPIDKNKGDKVKSKVESMLNTNRKTQDPKIEQTLAEFNKDNSLCERIQCAVNWYKDTKTSGQVSGHTTPDWVDELWTTHVQQLWTELSAAMTQKGTAEKEECKTLQDGSTASPSEKTACKYLHAGLKHLYTTSPTGDVLKNNQSLRQAMGCFLLHSYAKIMKEKAICNIEKGISRAFELGKKLSNDSNNANCSGAKGPCVPCKWDENILSTCKINTNGSADPDSKVEDKLKGIVKENNDAVVAAAHKMNEVKDLCDRVQCISERWLKQKQASNGKSGQPLTKRDWKDAWEEVKKEAATLGGALKEATSNEEKKKKVESFCSSIKDDKDGKEACLLIAAGLRNLYDIEDKGNNSVDASFQRTMRCVLLNAIADKMRKKLPCREERSVLEGIDKAFENSAKIKESNGCRDDKCFTCERFRGYKNCAIRENSTELEITPLKKKIDPLLNENKDASSSSSSSLTVESLTRTICGGQCKKMGSLCGRAQCAGEQWLEDRGKDKDQQTDRKEMWTEVQKEVTNLVTKVSDNGGRDTDTDSLCDSVQCPNDGAADCVSKTTCKLIVKALKDIHQIKKEDGSAFEGVKLNDRIFKSTMRCVALNAFIHTLKEHARKGGYGCAVEKGIKEAFLKGEEQNNLNKWCKDNGNEVGSCEPCEERLCFGTKIGKDDKLWSKVMEKLNTDSTIINTKIQPTLSEIKERVTLCDRVNCIAKWYHKKKGQGKGQEKFWKEEVKALWDELAGAMKTDGGNGTSGNGCNQMDDNGINSTRDATNPEKTACNYLHAALKQLYEPNASLSTGNSGILSKEHPSFRRTMGCFLLHAYAKKMKDEAKCEIEAGIKKAFKIREDLIANGKCTNSNGSCIQCKWDENLDKCNVTIDKTSVNVKTKVDPILKVDEQNMKTVIENINKMQTLCDYIRCAGPRWFKNGMQGTTNKSWCDFWEKDVKTALEMMFEKIDSDGKENDNAACNDFGDGNKHSVERKACNHIAAGLNYINNIQGIDNGQSNPTAKEDDKFFKQSMMCAALNFYADQIIKKSQDKCPIDEIKIIEMFIYWNANNKTSCPNSGSGGSNNNCFVCDRVKDSDFNCKLSVDSSLISTTPPSPRSGQNCPSNDDKKEVQKQMNELLDKESKVGGTLSTINKMTTFCSELQCAAKQYGKIKKGTGPNRTVTWNNIEGDAKGVLKELIQHMTKEQSQSDVHKYCNNDTEWSKLGHKQSKTNKAACLLFAAGLKHIYGRPNGQKKGPVNGPSFEQTMGCLFLKEYAKQLKEMAEEQKKYKVHPKCSVDEGINHAFNESENIMKSVLPQCDKNGSNNSCFVCTQNDYNNCQIGNTNVKTKVESIFQDEPNKNHMEKTLENTVCPILLTDLLTPFLPLAPVSIGLSAMAYYLWKYFGPLGKGGPRFRRSPAEILGPSVQEQVLDHVQQDSSHEYRLVKERKPRSAPTRTKRSGPVNRRTIIEIHFEVLDECQKGDTQLNQKDFLELLVQEFMGSEFMEEEQVPKEEVLMEGVPMESIPLEQVPMERVPSLGSGLLV
eukprot:XP_002260641.1 SICA antigen [Plasmodium knowlesi strain H]